MLRKDTRGEVKAIQLSIWRTEQPIARALTPDITPEVVAMRRIDLEVVQETIRVLRMINDTTILDPFNQAYRNS